MTEPWQLGLVEARTLLRKRHLSAVELVDSVLGRLQATEDRVLAWALVDETGAREAAQRVDAMIASNEASGVLLGIPVGIKDVIDTSGLRTEAGSEVLRGRVPSLDAPAVQELRRSGAIVLGKTVTHEFAFGQGDPPTRNPWDRHRYAGGSSVGSGAAVAIGSAMASLGTDTAGSVRNPAAINGLVGLKPSEGAVSRVGLINVSPTMDGIGPIARSVRDCEAMLRGIARDTFRTQAPAELPAQGLRIAVDRESWLTNGVTTGVKATMEAALATWTDIGVEVIDIPFRELSMALASGLAISLSEAAGVHANWLVESAEKYLPGTRVMLETGALVTEGDLRLAHAVRDWLRDYLQAKLADLGALAFVGPTLASIAPALVELKHGLTAAPGTATVSSALLLLSPASVTGLPAVSIPCGFSEGMPIGMQLMGRLHSDLLLLRLAERYEQATEWRTQLPIRDAPREATSLSTRADP